MLELLKMQQFQMERLTEDITAKLLKARLEMKDKFSRDKINEICSELKHSKDENQWKEFSTFIPELDSEFSKALTARYPELTINERRLCILLNMNLSTKEISENKVVPPNSTVNPSIEIIKLLFENLNAGAKIRKSYELRGMKYC